MSTSVQPAAPGAIRARRLGVRVDRVVIHTMEGTFGGTIAWFKRANRPVLTAAHYLVSARGDICQMVPDDKKALHCGSRTQAGWNDRSVGIEHEGWADRGALQWTEALLGASALVTATMLRKFQLPCDRTHVVGHSEIPGVDHHDPGPTWPWDAYMTLVRGLLLSS